MIPTPQTDTRLSGAPPPAAIPPVRRACRDQV